MLAINRAEHRNKSPERRAREHRTFMLGGLVEKSGLADLLLDNRSAILGALLEITERGQSFHGDAIRARWLSVGLSAFNIERDERGNA